ncbi:MAG: ABC transporter permease [bacterium]|nr:ABC transporter permease [bacterium]MDE0499998.1 ABC transporter permease [bacterium]MDE0600863.1 ABC transporter permease [bacterium]
MADIFSATVIVATLSSGIRLAVPLLLASLGEAFGQRSGVLNLGVDGIMLLGAFGGYFTTLKTQSPWLGLAVGLGVGLVLGLLSSVISVSLLAEQGISGIGVYLFGLGMSDLLFQKLVGTPLPAASFQKSPIPFLSEIPVVGDLFFNHSIPIYLAFLAIPVSTVIINRTRFGMNIRAVGENPEAADSQGISVTRVRYAAVTIGGILAGAAGAVLAIGLGIFQQNLTNAQGFIAIALVYFGAWRPLGVMAGSLVYGMVSAVVLLLKTRGIIPLGASDLAAMIPAVITVLALVVAARRFRAPTALTKPFIRGG